MLLVEWILLAVTAVAGGAVVAQRSLVLLARIRGREVPARLTCPKHGCRVACTLLADERRGRYVGVQACSLFERDGAPRCEQECARLINLGIPLQVEMREMGAEAPPPGETEPEA